MRLLILAVGRRMPPWVNAGFEDYARRLPRECRLQLTEIAPGQRGRQRDPARAIATEGRHMRALIPAGARVIALDERGESWSSVALAGRLRDWLAQSPDVCLLIGGPDGLAAECRALAHATWSLSPLTLPHALVRVVVAEQLYRAWSILGNHPYHRA